MRLPTLISQGEKPGPGKAESGDFCPRCLKGGSGKWGVSGCQGGGKPKAASSIPLKDFPPVKTLWGSRGEGGCTCCHFGPGESGGHGELPLPPSGVKSVQEGYRQGNKKGGRDFGYPPNTLVVGEGDYERKLCPSSQYGGVYL